MHFASIIIQKIFIMFLLALVGFLCGKIGIIDAATNKKLSTLALKLVTPCLIFASYQIAYDGAIVKNLFISFGLCLISYAIQIGAAFLLIRPRQKNASYRLERMCLIFSNCGFFGLPLIHSLYGSEGTIYLTAFIAVFNILLWIVGVPILIGKTSLKETVKNALSPAAIATVLGILCLVLRIPVPAVILEPIEMIGSMNTPFAMLAAGASIAHTSLIAACKKPRIYYVTFCKMLLIPAVTVATLSLFPLDSLLLNIQILAVACPTATACSMFAVLYDQDEGYASGIMTVTTLLSILTIPLIFLFAGVLGI